MLEKLKQLSQEFDNNIEKSVDFKAVEDLRILYLGRKGELTSLLRNVNTLSPEEKPKFGQAANVLKQQIQAKIDEKLLELKKKEANKRVASETIDVTLPGRKVKAGKKHPITIIFEEIKDIFTKLGFVIADGPEIENNYYNFDALNFPPDHPAKDMQDTIYLEEDLLLRTHTSPVQIRVFEKENPPIKIIAPGKVYRHDADVSHSPMFHQVEGFYVDEDVTFGDLKWILNHFAKTMFGENVSLRFRPSFFPFTEPSAEIDISCFICGAKGCRACSGTGWIEILGAGMIDPNVFKAVGYDTDKYSGFAFGMGVERIAMLKFGINDIRLFFENDEKFLNQFTSH